ncbi:MAG TPA: hypothetical protein VJ862_06705 [Rhodanobacteraceae bacterium]|nr:hypothetical protein [Rhodanobacteraceae bacterium]
MTVSLNGWILLVIPAQAGIQAVVCEDQHGFRVLSAKNADSPRMTALGISSPLAA